MDQSTSKYDSLKMRFRFKLIHMGFEGAVVAEKIKLPTNTRFLFSLHFTKKAFCCFNKSLYFTNIEISSTKK